MSSRSSGVEASALLAGRMQRHFDRLAPAYNAARTTDPEPVEYLRAALDETRMLRCADVGCGGGRYDALLLRALPKIRLTCYDANRRMLEEASAFLQSEGLGGFSLRLADAENLPADDGPFDCVVSFNAVHHFDATAFLRCAARVLLPGGLVFVYTRLREQNEASIWGRYFPGFVDKETRLYGCLDVEAWVRQVPGLELTTIQPFQYRRKASLDRLVELASLCHYSTFDLYSERELRDAVEEFSRRVRRTFRDETEVEWVDGNTMIVFRAAITGHPS